MTNTTQKITAISGMIHCNSPTFTYCLMGWQHPDSYPAMLYNKGYIKDERDKEWGDKSLDSLIKETVSSSHLSSEDFSPVTILWSVFHLGNPVGLSWLKWGWDTILWLVLISQICFYIKACLVRPHISLNCQTERELSLAQQSLSCLQTFPEAVTDKCQRVVAKLGELLGSDH